MDRLADPDELRSYLPLPTLSRRALKRLEWRFAAVFVLVLILDVTLSPFRRFLPHFKTPLIRSPALGPFSLPILTRSDQPRISLLTVLGHVLVAQYDRMIRLTRNYLAVRILVSTRDALIDFFSIGRYIWLYAKYSCFWWDEAQLRTELSQAGASVRENLVWPVGSNCLRDALVIGTRDVLDVQVVEPFLDEWAEGPGKKPAAKKARFLREHARLWQTSGDMPLAVPARRDPHLASLARQMRLILNRMCDQLDPEHDGREQAPPIGSADIDDDAAAASQLQREAASAQEDRGDRQAEGDSQARET